MKTEIIDQLQDSARVKNAVAETLADKIADAAQAIIKTYRSGGKL